MNSMDVLKTNAILWFFHTNLLLLSPAELTATHLSNSHYVNNIHLLLPVEILMKIFSYLPSYSDVCLVNKIFYNVACKVNDANVHISFLSIFTKDASHRSSVMKSIQNTQRKISKVKIDFRSFAVQCGIRQSAIFDVVKIIKKFSSSIKYLKLENIWLEMSHFLQLLSLVPNAEHLVFSNVHEKQQKDPTQHQLRNECFNLHRLKTLELYECCDEFMIVFNRLPQGVLKELAVFEHILNLDFLTGIFMQQANIKELRLKGERTSSYRFKVNLSHPNEYNSRLATILSNLTKLTSLTLRGRVPAKDILNVVTNQFRELNTLDICVEEGLSTPFKNIVKLKKLKELTLRSCTLKFMETLAALDNSRITTLNIHMTYMDNLMSICVLANSVPNLKVLRFHYSYDCEVIMAVILENFNYIEVLEISFDKDSRFDLFNTVAKVDRCFNPKLTEFKLSRGIACEESSLNKLIVFFPNLKKLDILSTKPLSISQFKVILNGFRNLKSLNLISFQLEFNTEYLDYINDYKNNLKSLTLSGIDYSFELTPEYKKKLSDLFDVIRYNNRTLHMTNEY